MENLENDRSIQTQVQKPATMIHVRCPDCFKQYTVNPQEILDAKPKFQCVDCSSQFWIAYPEVLEQKEVIGFPVSWLDTSSQAELEKSARAEDHLPENLSEKYKSGFIAAPQLDHLDFEDVAPQEHISSEDVQQTVRAVQPTPLEEKEITPPLSYQSRTTVERQFSCPKCEGQNASGASECQHCGVVMKVFSKRIQDVERFPLSHNVSPELKARWEWVKDHYDDLSVHQNFLNQAVSAGQMQFSLTCYRNMLDVNGSDEVALAMQKQIVALTVQGCMGPVERETMLETSSKRRGSIYRSVFSIANITVVLSTILITMGYFIPSLRNLMGIGVSVLFIALALRYHFKLI